MWIIFILRIIDHYSLTVTFSSKPNKTCRVYVPNNCHIIIANKAMKYTSIYVQYVIALLFWGGRVKIVVVNCTYMWLLGWYTCYARAPRFWNIWSYWKVSIKDNNSILFKIFTFRLCLVGSSTPAHTKKSNVSSTFTFLNAW